MPKEIPKCPSCDSDNVVRIAYGYPAPATKDAAMRGEVSLGGCIIQAGNPEWHCNDCKHEW